MAKGKLIGRPPKFKSAEEIKEKIDAYFEECVEKPVLDENGEILTTNKGAPVFYPPKPPTVTGLALFLGFTSRQALLNYQAKRDFVDTITRAKSRIEEYAEGRLFDRDGVNGAKFSLINNFKGWSENPIEDGAEKLDQVNENLQTLAELLRNPVPDRKIEDE